MQALKEIIEDGKEVIENTKEIVEDRKELIEEIFEKAEDYLKTNLQLIKLKATDKVAGVVSNLVSQIAIVMLGFLFLLMLSIGIAFWIGLALGQTYYGFMIVAGFYLLLTMIVIIFKKELIKNPISNSIISQAIKE